MQTRAFMAKVCGFDETIPVEDFVTCFVEHLWEGVAPAPIRLKRRRWLR